MLHTIAICLSVRIKQRFSWKRCIFTLTNHIFAEQHILVNCGKFITEFIVFYGKVEIYLNFKLIKEIQFMSLFSFFGYVLTGSLIVLLQ